MQGQAETQFLHNHPDAYWCSHCWKFTLDCAHLVDPLEAPLYKLDHWQYLAVAREDRVLEVTMNTGERYQLFEVPRVVARGFAKSPSEELLRGYRFERVRGRFKRDASL